MHPLSITSRQHEVCVTTILYSPWSPLYNHPEGTRILSVCVLHSYTHGTQSDWKQLISQQLSKTQRNINKDIMQIALTRAKIANTKHLGSTCSNITSFIVEETHQICLGTDKNQKAYRPETMKREPILACRRTPPWTSNLLVSYVIELNKVASL